MTRITTLKVGRRTGLVDTLATPFYISHRGGPYLHPEHSMEGYRASANAGFLVEPDVQTLADGTLVSIHDATVDRTMTGTGNVSALTRAQWRALQIKPKVAGGDHVQPVEWEQVLNEFGGRAILVPEVKSTTALTPLLDSIERRGLHRDVIVQSFTYAHAQAAAARGIAAMWLSDVATPATVKAAGVEFIGASQSATPAYMASCVAAGLKVVVWTVSTRAAAATAFTNGAVGVFSDDPWWTANVIPKRNADMWDARALSPGWWTNGDNSALVHFGRKGELGAGTAAASATLTYPFRWAGVRGPHVKLRWRVRFDRQSNDDLTRWIGVYFGTQPHVDVPFTDGATYGGDGYHFLVRRNGDHTFYRADAGVATGLASSGAGQPDIAIFTAEGFADFEAVIDATGVRFTNLTSGSAITFADTTYRGTANGVTARWNGSRAYLSNLSIEDIA